MGSAREAADEMRSWIEETDIDGFDLAYALTQGTFKDIADLAAPELRSRGMYKHDYPTVLSARSHSAGVTAFRRTIPPVQA